MRRLGLVVVLVACALAAAVGSCKQGEGERCQVQADCSGNLVCNQATGTCQSSSSGVDGKIAPDARRDGGMPDAAPDAAFDAAPDARVDAHL